MIKRATEIINNLKKTIGDYQKELTINSNISEEDTTVSLTQKSISDAMKNNKTTQEISANMQAIAKQQKSINSIDYNYALVCDGQINMIAATNKVQLNESINAIANAGNYKDIQLYHMTFTPVQLKTQTILTAL